MYADLDKLRTTEDTYLKKSILYCISQAFGEVYADVLENAFPNQKVPLKDVLAVEPLIDILKNQLKINTDAEVLRALISVFREDAADDYCGEMVHNPEDEIMLPVSYILVSLSILKEQIFDLDIMDFSDNVINSVKTDVEILKATSDLLSILVVGNQVLIASWNHSHIRND
jgi:hypothetical protein